MKKLVQNSLIIISFITMMMSSCVSHNQLINYQDLARADTSVVMNLPKSNLLIQPKDVLSIRVFSADEKLAEPFNFRTDQNNNFSIAAIQLGGYLVDDEGFVDFPILGRIMLKGLNTSKAKEKIKEMLKNYLKDPVVSVRLLNFRITITGEVVSPGSFDIVNERISLIDAIGLSGGLTNYANRTNVLLVRETGEKKVGVRINLQDLSFFESEYYYLKQNDIIYVEPLRSKAGAVSDQTNKAVPIVSAVATVTAVLIALFSN